MPLANVNFSRKITKPERPILIRPYRRREKHGLSLERLGRRSDKLGRSRLVSPSYYELNSVTRSMPRLIKCGFVKTPFLELPKSFIDVTQFFHAHEGQVMEKLFWLQFNMPKHPLLNKQMAQWAELHKISRSAMRDIVVRLWPIEPIPNSYVGLA